METDSDTGPVSKGNVLHLNIIENLIMSIKYNYLRCLCYIVVSLDGVYDGRRGKFYE